MSDRPDSVAATEQTPQSDAPAWVPAGDAGDDFWKLAKKGVVAWGHEPTTEEMVSYWRSLIDEERRETAAALVPAAAPEVVVEDPVEALAALARLGTRPPPTPDAGIATLTGLLALAPRPAPAPDAGIATLAGLLALAPRPAPAPDAGIATLAGLLALASRPSGSPDGGIVTLAGLLALGAARSARDEPVTEVLATLAGLSGWSPYTVTPDDALAAVPDRLVEDQVAPADPSRSSCLPDMWLPAAPAPPPAPVAPPTPSTPPPLPAAVPVIPLGPPQPRSTPPPPVLPTLSIAPRPALAVDECPPSAVQEVPEAQVEVRAQPPPPVPVEPAKAPVVTPEAVGWLAAAVAGPPEPPGDGRTWWRVAAARPLALGPGPMAAAPGAGGEPGAVPDAEIAQAEAVSAAAEAAVAEAEGAAVSGAVAAEVREPDTAEVGEGIEPDAVEGDAAETEAVEVAAGAAVPAADREGGGGVGRGLGLAGGGLAFADCLGLLERRRRAQHAHRRWGRHIGLPVAPLDAYERELRHGADADAAEHLELALRAAAAGAGPEGLPPLRWVEAAADEVLLAFASDETWSSHGDTHELADRALAPFPLLAPLGVTPAGRECLIDLEAKGVTTVDGPPDDVLGLLRSVVVAMSTAAWCAQLRIVVVGMEPELDGLPGVETVDSLDVALTYAEAHVHEVTTALAARGETSISRVRALGLSSAGAKALLIVSAQPPADPVVWQRVEALAERRSSGVGVLLRHSAADDPDCCRLRIDDGGWIAGGLWARRLDAVDARRLVGLLEVANRRDGGETALRPRADARSTDDGIEVLVRVLGDVEVVRRDGPAEEPLVPTVPAAVEVLAYLGLRESSVTHAVLEASLFPDGAPVPYAVDGSVTAAVELVGPGLVRRPTPGRFGVSDGVATDYGLFCDLVARADAALEAGDRAAAAERLTTALDMVRSAPLGGPGRRYAWAGPAREAIVAQVVDAAETLAALGAAGDDWAAVERAAGQGLKAAPGSERLHRWHMRAAHAAGDLDRVHELFEELCDVVADPAVGVEPEDTLQTETVQLLEGLVSRRPSAEPAAIADPAEACEPTEPTGPGEVRRLAPDRPLPITEELPEVAAVSSPAALIA